LEIEYETRGRLKIERPDLLVIIGANKELWTIKKLSATPSQYQENEMKDLATQLLAHGYQQRLIDVDVLGHEPSLGNAITLLKLGRGQISYTEREALRILFAERSGRLTWADIASGIAGPCGKNILCRLVLEGVVRFDPTGLWADAMVFYWVGGGINHPEGRL
jgi:hypothetical protein